MLEAASAAEKMSKRMPQDAVWYGKLANIYKECGMYAEAQAAYKEAIKLSPRFSYERRTYKKALERCDKAAKGQKD
jgi:tetratricopeptide (TPR) repeat protein